MNNKQKLHQLHLNKWAARFADQKSSGLTVRQWCKQNNYTIHTYNYWNNESAGKKQSAKNTHAVVYLKPALVQCAHAIINSSAAPYYKNKYERISKRRAKKRAMIAIARAILTAIYQMLSNDKVWNPCNLYKFDMPQEMQDKQKPKAIKQALNLLVSKGVISPKSPSVAN